VRPAVPWRAARHPPRHYRPHRLPLPLSLPHHPHHPHPHPPPHPPHARPAYLRRAAEGRIHCLSWRDSARARLASNPSARNPRRRSPSDRGRYGQPVRRAVTLPGLRRADGRWPRVLPRWRPVRPLARSHRLCLRRSRWHGRRAPAARQAAQRRQAKSRGTRRAMHDRARATQAFVNTHAEGEMTIVVPQANSIHDDPRSRSFAAPEGLVPLLRRPGARQRRSGVDHVSHRRARASRGAAKTLLQAAIGAIPATRGEKRVQ
jgi:hypothetical protein